MMARVIAADGSGRGKLAIAGAVIDAELPKHVRAGQDLRLTVRDVSAHQVVLGMSDQPAGVPVPAAELPGGGRASGHRGGHLRGIGFGIARVAGVADAVASLRRADAWCF